MSISTNVNTSTLKENFELEVFNYFLKKIERKKEGNVTNRKVLWFILLGLFVMRKKCKHSILKTIFLFLYFKQATIPNFFCEAIKV